MANPRPYSWSSPNLSDLTGGEWLPAYIKRCLTGPGTLEEKWTTESWLLTTCGSTSDLEPWHKWAQWRTALGFIIFKAVLTYRPGMKRPRPLVNPKDPMPLSVPEFWDYLRDYCKQEYSKHWRGWRHAIFERRGRYPRNGIFEAEELFNETWISIHGSPFNEVHTWAYIFIRVGWAFDEAKRQGARRNTKWQIGNYSDMKLPKLEKEDESVVHVWDQDVSSGEQIAVRIDNLIAPHVPIPSRFGFCTLTWAGLEFLRVNRLVRMRYARPPHTKWVMYSERWWEEEKKLKNLQKTPELTTSIGSKAGKQK